MWLTPNCPTAQLPKTLGTKGLEELTGELRTLMMPISPYTHGYITMSQCLLYIHICVYYIHMYDYI